MNLLDSILARYRANRKLGNLVIAMTIAAVVHRWPETIAWLPKETREMIQNGAYMMLNGLGIILVAWWAKQHNTSGTGAPLDPYVKPDKAGGTKTLLVLPLVALGFSGCVGSGPGGAFTPDDFAAINRGVNDAVTTYERVRYPDRPVYPPGAPFPVYPVQP